MIHLVIGHPPTNPPISQNQTNYQQLFLDPSVNMMPFIGAIISPFDTRQSSPSSSITMFYVEPSQAPRPRPRS